MKNTLMDARGQHPSATNDASGAHLWIFATNSKTLNLHCTAETNVLSAHEQERARRYRSPDRKQAFVESRSGIRCILSGYLKAKPADVCLTALPSGRPVVLDSEGQETLSISISHTGGLVALAIAPVDIAVGVDIEDPANLINESAIRTSFLTDAERSMIDRCDVTDRKRLMLQIWTAKEAAFKAAGGGPSTSLMDFELEGDADSLAFGKGSRLIQFCVAPDSVAAACWRSAPTASVVGSIVSGRHPINASGTDAKNTACFAEVAENPERILAAMAIRGVECGVSSLFRWQNIS